MFIIGCDFHSRFQQIAMLSPTNGEVIERRLEHENGEAQKFYATLPSPARVGMEATCDAQWFAKVLREHHPRTLDRNDLRRRSVPPWCGSRRRTPAMPYIFSTCCSPTGFLGSGYHRRRSGICGKCCGIGTSWFGFVPR